MNDKKIILSVIFIISFTVLFSQNIFLLERPGSIKNYKYYVNSPIRLKIISPDTLISGEISRINDTSIIVNFANEIALKNISCIYTKRWGVSFLQKIFLFTGIPYLALSVVNGAINNDNTVVSKNTFIISGCLIGAGIALMPLTKRKHKIDNKKWRLKILNFEN
ncbi:MAG: hypothetical protein B6D61_01560 [Bacteroidetes bacterium 4484_249]|nr:MAG: hypothetical protein B6D61_01560 [Bacteroidetes bacterium 4484_249]